MSISYKKNLDNNDVGGRLLEADPTYFSRAPSTHFRDLLGVGKENYCRYLWSFRIPEGKSPWRAIGNRQSGKKTTTLTDFFLDASIGRDCSIDCFMSPNQFFDWRNAKQLASLHANWLEIDITRDENTLKKAKESLTEEEEKSVLNEVFSQLQASGIPAPTCYVMSGSGGMHLYWIYEAIPAYKWCINAWREIADKLVKSVQGGKLWHVDLGASKDPARVLRMPGSKHGTTRRNVEVHTGGNSYTFEQLATKLTVPVKKPELSIVPNLAFKTTTNTAPNAPVSKPNPMESPHGRKHTIGQWWFKVFTHVHTFATKNKITEGKRDATAFILFVALRHIQSEAVALERIMDINKRLIGLDEDVLKGYLKTATHTLYKYKKSTLDDYLTRQLGMDTSWLYSTDKKLYTASEVKNLQKEAAKNTALKKSHATLGRIISAVKELLQAKSPLTQASVAAICGRSVRTVRRYWSVINNLEVIRSPSIYSPPEDCPIEA